MTRQELLDALTVERFGTPTPEWKPRSEAAPAPMPAESPRSLRLVVDRRKKAG